MEYDIAWGRNTDVGYGEHTDGRSPEPSPLIAAARMGGGENRRGSDGDGVRTNMKPPAKPKSRWQRNAVVNANGARHTGADAASTGDDVARVTGADRASEEVHATQQRQ
jgi:hypothetical protein